MSAADDPRTRDELLAEIASLRQQLAANRRTSAGDSEELRLILDAIPALVAYIDASESYCLVNRAYEEWFELPRGAILGKTLREVLGEPAYLTIRPHVRAALAGDRVSYATDLDYPHGTRRHIEASYTPHVGADVGGVGGLDVAACAVRVVEVGGVADAVAGQGGAHVRADRQVGGLAEDLAQGLAEDRAARELEPFLVGAVDQAVGLGRVDVGDERGDRVEDQAQLLGVAGGRTAIRGQLLAQAGDLGEQLVAGARVVGGAHGSPCLPRRGRAGQWAGRGEIPSVVVSGGRPGPGGRGRRWRGRRGSRRRRCPSTRPGRRAGGRRRGGWRR